jgi:hypothetical protein
MSEDGGTILAAVCPSKVFCGVGIRSWQPGDAIPASLQDGAADGLLFRSLDGGATWNPDGTIPPQVMLGGIINDRTFTWQPSTVNGEWRAVYRWLDNGEQIFPPANVAAVIPDPWLSIVPGIGLTWADRGTSEEPLATYDFAGNLVHEPSLGDAPGHERVFLRDAESRIYVSTGVEGEGLGLNGHTSVVARFETGQLERLVEVPGLYFRIPISGSTFGGWGNLRPGEHATYVVDFDAATAAPLPELDQVVDEHMSAKAELWLNFGAPPLRVNTPRECLNVRPEPNTTAEEVVCASHGALLRHLGEERDGWINVEAPGGAQGWVSEQFVIR